MSTGFNQTVKQFIIKNGGAKAKSLLSVESGLSVHLIEKIQNSDHEARPENVLAIQEAMNRISARKSQSTAS